MIWFWFFISNEANYSSDIFKINFKKYSKMTLKLLLLCLFFSPDKAQNYEQPEFAINQTFTNLGPSSIHSITGKFYEEKQREIPSKPKTYNKPILNSEVNIASQLQDTLTNTEQPRPTNSETILYRRNKDRPNIKKEPELQKTNSQNHLRNHIPKRQQKAPANNTDSMLFHAEKVVSSYDKNKSIEIIKKELAFDSLLIKNDFSNTTVPPSNMMTSHMSYEIGPEADIVHDPVLIKVDAAPVSTRRFVETNTNHEPILPNNFPMPLAYENNKNIPDNVNIPSTELLRQNNNPIMDENKIRPITHFVPPNYGINMPINRNTDMKLRQNICNIKDKSICDEQESDEILERSGNDIQLKDPTKGTGISYLGKSRVILLDHPRVCYACNSINDPFCWSPDRSTAVKYCRTDHPSCLIKLYKYKGLSYIIRDCGNTCKQSDLAGDTSKYTYCTICYHDLCNSAHHLKIQNVIIIMLLIFHFCSLY